MKKLTLSLLMLCAVFAAGAGAGRGQSALTPVISPPAWIQGEWHNSTESDSRRFEWFTFTTHGITLSEGMPLKKVVDFSRRYRGYRVKQTAGEKTYRVEFSKGKDSLVYEFRLCEAGACVGSLGDGLIYSVTRNERFVRGNTASLPGLLFRREGR